MKNEVISQDDKLVIRRMVLEPGEAMPWHNDACRRFGVVLRGERLNIEFRDSDERIAVDVHAGLAGWDEPDPRVHRAVNTGLPSYEEVVVFLLEVPGTDPQPIAQ